MVRINPAQVARYRMVTAVGQFGLNLVPDEGLLLGEEGEKTVARQCIVVVVFRFQGTLPSRYRSMLGLQLRI